MGKHTFPEQAEEWGVHRFVVDRVALGRAPLRAGDEGAVPTAEDVVAGLEELWLPDGLPFFVEADGSETGVWSLNRYLTTAVRLGGLKVSSVQRTHSYHLARLLRFVRERTALRLAAEAGCELDEYLGGHGVPMVDLTAVTEADLVSYRDARSALAPRSWCSELGSISGFFGWAEREGLVPRDPIPRWGAAGRPTIARRIRKVTLPKYLEPDVLRAFLALGLRDEGDDSVRTPERDHAFGALLVATGLRREEASLLLEAEVPPADAFTAPVVDFVRVGKKDVPRRVLVSKEAAGVLDRYRHLERGPVVEASQRRLARRVREGALMMASSRRDGRGRLLVQVGDEGEVPGEAVPNDLRARLVTCTDEGALDPMALFVSYTTGEALDLGTWDQVFTTAQARLAASGSPHQPRAGLRITPHVMRSTFAVRMLAGLMRLGRDRVGDAYAFVTNPLITVQMLLGHASPATTAGYLQAAEGYDDDLAEAFAQHVADVLGTRR
ncbi:MAG: tyrosine-type recombinase/integrase [Acidimicrobiales bacterium]